MTSSSLRVVRLHATPVAIEPVRSSMARLWPEIEAVNLLDDSLTIDRAKEGPDLSNTLCERFVPVWIYLEARLLLGAQGPIWRRQGASRALARTCSAFGPAIDRVAAEVPIPVLKPNEAMFREAIAAGTRIGMLATFAPAVSTMINEFELYVAETGKAATLDTVIVPEAIDLLRLGDSTTHNRLIAEQAPSLAQHDAIMLAHLSTSRALEAVRSVVNVPALSAPDAAVKRMRALVMT